MIIPVNNPAGKYFSFRNVLIFFLLLFLLFSLIHNSYSFLDPDFGWHLKVGQHILQDGRVPTKDIYDFTLNGKNWVDHEWLSDTFLYLLYSNFGYFATTLFFAGIIMLGVILLHRWCTKNFIKGDMAYYFFLMLEAMGINASLPQFGPRIQEITFLFLIILLILLHKYIVSQNKTLLLILPPFFYIWACLHAGFLIGLFILLLWIISQMASAMIKKFNLLSFMNFEYPTERHSLTFVSLILLMSFLSTLFTPYGIELYKFIFDYSNTFYMLHISEWLPQYVYPYQYWQMLYLIITMATFKIWLIFNAEKLPPDKVEGTPVPFLKIPFWNFIIFAFFFCLAIKSRRHFPLFFAVSLPLIAMFLNSFFQKIFTGTPSSKLFSTILKTLAILIIFLSSIQIFLSLKNSTALKMNRDPFGQYCSFYPCEAATFLKNNPQYDDKKLFNYYGWGGYLIWNLPERKLFIDGRLPQYKIGNSTFLEEYLSFFKPENFEQKADQYDIGLLLLYKEKPLEISWFEKNILLLDFNEANEKNLALNNYLTPSPKWKKIYEDEVSLIYTRKSN